MNTEQRVRRALEGVRGREKFDYRGFCSLMVRLRSRLPAGEKSLDRVAARAGLKRGQLYGFETVTRRSRRVDRHTIQALAVLYGATAEEQRELLEAAGHDYVPPTLLAEAASAVTTVLDEPSFSDAVRREFVKDLVQYVERWQTLRRSREARPRRAVIAAAGWQAQIFREDRFQRSLFPAVNEAVNAGMDEVLIVVPPTLPRLRLLERTFREKRVRIKLVFQERALGLGNVLVAAKPQLLEEPFALMLPDDVDDEMICLQRMIQLYDKVRKPIIAVEPVARENLALTRNFGIAVLAAEPVLTIGDRLFDLRGDLQEKPSNPIMDDRAHKILGRYVFTPELFAALTDHNLTGAINRAWGKSSGVCAYVVERPLASIARLKDIIVDMDRKEIFGNAYYR